MHTRLALGLFFWEVRAGGGENPFPLNYSHGIDAGLSKKNPDRSSFEKGLELEGNGRERHKLTSSRG